jgi:hypothetical protein
MKQFRSVSFLCVSKKESAFSPSAIETMTLHGSSMSLLFVPRTADEIPFYCEARGHKEPRTVDVNIVNFEGFFSSHPAKTLSPGSGRELSNCTRCDRSEASTRWAV